MNVIAAPVEQLTWVGCRGVEKISVLCVSDVSKFLAFSFNPGFGLGLCSLLAEDANQNFTALLLWISWDVKPPFWRVIVMTQLMQVSSWTYVQLCEPTTFISWLWPHSGNWVLPAENLLKLCSETGPSCNFNLDFTAGLHSDSLLVTHTYYLAKLSWLAQRANYLVHTEIRKDTIKVKKIRVVVAVRV